MLTGRELIRRRLDARPSVVEALRLWRAEHSLVALVGNWAVGDALIAFDPVRTLASDADPFGQLDQPVGPSHGSIGQFAGGWLGSWGYQLACRIETLPAAPPRPTPTSDFTLAYYDWALVLRSGRWWFEAAAEADRLEAVEAAYDRAAVVMDSMAPNPQPYVASAFTLGSGAAGYHHRAVARAREHIDAGDIFQANICLRLDAEFDGDPLDVFCAGVDRLKPAYGAFVRTITGALASFSPELFLHREGDLVRTSPIKGTAPLHTDPDDLVASAKDRAENIMIVDLMRNDLGRVAVPGTVQVNKVAGIERHAVWHLVSDIEARLRPDVSNGDLLRATFPPGSVTGAPKVRAMGIINALESTGRETYTGAIGYVGPAELELNVAIRTFEFDAGRVWLGAGGGITVASNPSAEFEECMDKALPLLAAIGAQLDIDCARTEHVAVAGGADQVAAGPQLQWRADPQRGVFTTALVCDGRIDAVQQHTARLAASLLELYGGQLPADFAAHVHQNAAGLAGLRRMRVTVMPSGAVQTEVSVLHADDGPWSLTPVVLHGGLGAHKWCDRPPLDLETLIIDIDGAVLETVRANLFIVRDDAVCTPSADGRILPGIARERVIKALAAANIPFREQNISVADLSTATEVFATNSLRGIVPVVSCDEVGAWPVGKTTRRLHELLARPGSSPASAQQVPESFGGARVLLIDNYDSFVFNLAQYFAELGAHTDVVRNDAITVDELIERYLSGDITHLVISPGPGTPAEAGISNEAVRRLGPKLPTLGVCLGHQCIGEVFGADIVCAPQVVHGRPSLIHHDGAGIFAGLATPLVAARYHSLVIDPDSMPDSLVTTAHTGAGVIMGVRHRCHPIVGIQLHPESILTPQGHELLGGFLRSVGWHKRQGN